MDAGPQYKLPVIPPPDTAPCTGFSVGDDGDGTKIPKAEECLGDLIRIPECCQGSRPTATQDAYCGWILNIDNAQAAKSNIPLLVLTLNSMSGVIWVLKTQLLQQWILMISRVAVSFLLYRVRFHKE